MRAFCFLEHRRQTPPFASEKKQPEEAHSFMRLSRPPDTSRSSREALLANYQPTVTVAIVGAAVCSDELKPPTSS